MKRRVLIVLAAVAAAAVAQDVPRAKWIENGLIDAGGNHEPTIFVVRRGGQRLDARERNDAAESEETLRRLKEQGVEVFHTHFYKGFGMAAEMPGMEQTKRTAELVHLVNYTAGKNPVTADVTYSLPEGKTARTVRICSPDAAEAQAVETKGGPSKVSFSVPVKIYTVAVIEW